MPSLPSLATLRILACVVFFITGSTSIHLCQDIDAKACTPLSTHISHMQLRGLNIAILFLAILVLAAIVIVIVIVIGEVFEIRKGGY